MSPRFPFEYAGIGIDSLVARRDALTDAIEQGNQTRVGVSSGIAHEFNAMKPEEQKATRIRVCLALHLLWLDGNPDVDPTENPYPDPSVTKVMQVTQIFC